MSEQVATALAENSVIENGRVSGEAVAAKDSSTAGTSTLSQTKTKKLPPKCRFFNTKQGCRAGSSCPFRHEVSGVGSVQNESAKDSASNSLPALAETSREDNKLESGKKPGPSQRPLVVPDPTRTVQRPTAPAEKLDPRTFQINQIKRRFSPKEETIANGDLLLHFGMPPSDPDFPFDIDLLECTLRLPIDFLVGGRPPTLRVTNKVMERGYQINVEQGFDAIWSQFSNPTLLNAMKSLDRQLETLLTAQKAEVFKIVVNARPKPALPTPRSNTVQVEASAPPTSKSVLAASAPVVQRPPISPQRREEARKNREEQTQILEHRLGRNPHFRKEANGTMFTVPIEARKKGDLPPSLQNIKLVRLLVPEEYDIEPCSVELIGVEADAAAIAVEKAFFKRAREVPDATLLAQINYLASNIHIMAKEIAEDPRTELQSVVAEESESENFVIIDKAMVEASQTEQIQDTEKEHVKLISRPPEWDLAFSSDSDDSEEDENADHDSDDTGSTDDSGDSNETDSDETRQQPTTTSTAPAEKGILLSFPGLEMHNIELLELALINLTVRCERCKDRMDVLRLRPSVNVAPTTSSSNENPNQHQKQASTTISTHCKKCSLPYSLSYRPDILHANSIRAGYLDLVGCTPFDLLPSIFNPTCSTCSTPSIASTSTSIPTGTGGTQGVTAARSASATSFCRTCHARMNFTFPETRFLRISSAAHGAAASLPRKKPKTESLGIVAGTPLPSKGTCAHYKRSYRWFRFSCCGKIFACDKCHDSAPETDHTLEFANRMICGFCSREQIYRPEECGMQGCRRSLVGAGSKGGFWEGGQGTRDVRKMSRKDPRKYKHRRGGKIVSKDKKEKGKGKE